MKKERTEHLLIGFILFLVSVVFHSYNLGFTSLDLDESVHVWHAQQSYAHVVEQASNDPNPPVFNVMISWWVKHFGVEERTLRTFSVLWGSLAVVLLYFIGLRNFNKRVGIMVALLFCASPMVFRFTHLVRPYTLLLFTVIASYGMLFELVRKPSNAKRLMYYLCTTLMIYVHPTSIFNIPAHGLIALIFNRSNWKSLLSLWSLMVLSVLSFGAYYLVIPYFENEVEMWFDAPDWEDVWYVLNVFYGKWYIMAIQLALLLTAAMIPSVRKQFVKRGTLIVSIMMWIGIPMMVSVIFSHIGKPVFQDKYVLSSLPGILFLLAATTDVVVPGRFKWILFGCSVTISLSYVRFEPFTEGDWKHAVAYINEDFDQRTAVFLTPWYEFSTFTYYNDPEAYRQTDSTMKYMVQKNVLWAWHDVVRPGDTLAKFDRLYLVSAHVGYAVPEFNIDSLNQHASLLEERQFSGVNVRKYRLNETR